MDSSMVGRDDQLTTIRRLTAASAAGQPCLALVLGEAGIGKSRLVSELIAGGETRASTLLGHCTAVGSRDVPLTPLLDAIRDLRAQLGTTTFDRIAGGRPPDASCPELSGPTQRAPGADRPLRTPDR